MELTQYNHLARIFQYPDETLPQRMEAIVVFFRNSFPEVAGELDIFCRYLPRDNVEKMQELFIRTFDVQAITTLDIGYVLFGDDYKRGELLAHLNREHRSVENDCGSELADHLSNLLQLIAKLGKSELSCELVQEILTPAIDKMINEFDPERIKKKDELYEKHYKTILHSYKERNTLYLHALKALRNMFDIDFHPERKTELYQTIDFLKSLGREIEIEKET